MDHHKGEEYRAGCTFGGVLIAFGMGLYQAYLSCACIVLVGYFIYSLCKESTTAGGIAFYVLKAMMAGIFGGVLYVIILNVHLKVFHLVLSEYNGANLYSLSNTLANLSASIVRAYREFFRYFGGEMFILNTFRKIPLYYIAFALFLVLFVGNFIKLLRSNWMKAALYLLFIFLIPVACNIVVLIATAADISVLMTPALALCVPVLLCIQVNLEVSKFLLWVRRLNYLVIAIILYGSMYQIQIDQHAMLEGQTAVAAMGEGIVHRLDQEGYLNPEWEYCVIGVADYNDLFAGSRIYEQSNMYARFGSWYRDPSCMRRSWQGVFSYLCGINLKMCSSEVYGILCGDATVQSMPAYPEQGCIMMKENVVVIKISEY